MNSINNHLQTTVAYVQAPAVSYVDTLIRQLGRDVFCLIFSYFPRADIEQFESELFSRKLAYQILREDAICNAESYKILKKLFTGYKSLSNDQNATSPMPAKEVASLDTTRFVYSPIVINQLKGKKTLDLHEIHFYEDRIPIDLICKTIGDSLIELDLERSYESEKYHRLRKGYQSESVQAKVAMILEQAGMHCQNVRSLKLPISCSPLISSTFCSSIVRWNEFQHLTISPKEANIIKATKNLDSLCFINCQWYAAEEFLKVLPHVAKTSLNLRSLEFYGLNLEGFQALKNVAKEWTKLHRLAINGVDERALGLQANLAIAQLIRQSSISEYDLCYPLTEAILYSLGQTKVQLREISFRCIRCIGGDDYISKQELTSFLLDKKNSLNKFSLGSVPDQYIECFISFLSGNNVIKEFSIGLYDENEFDQDEPAHPELVPVDQLYSLITVCLEIPSVTIKFTYRDLPHAFVEYIEHINGKYKNVNLELPEPTVRLEEDD